jgi:hypothetical protein
LAFFRSEKKFNGSEGMVLTYNMVMDRLDTLNHREQQVRKFYKPLPSVDKAKPYPRRHRFADVLEPGDVVRTIDKGGDGAGWDEGVEHGGEEGEGAAQNSTGGGVDPLAQAGMRENRIFGPGRDGQRLVKQVSTKERQLRKMIDGELNDRKERLKSRLYREVGVAQDGEAAPKDDEIDKINPLFKQVGNAQMMFPRPTVHKTGSATAQEIKVGEYRPRYTGGAIYKAVEGKPGAEELALEQLEEAEHIEDGHGAGEETSQEVSFSRSASIRSNLSGRSGLQRVGSGISAQAPLMEEPSGMLYESDEEDAAGMFSGPISSWGYRKSLYSEHDDPARPEFYYTPIALPPNELEHDPAETLYEVKLVGITLPGQPEHVCAAAGRNKEGKLLFQRPGDTDGTMLGAFLDIAEVLPWVNAPKELLGQELKIVIFRRSTDKYEEGYVSERVVTFRAPSAEQLSKIPQYPRPPTSAPEGERSRQHLDVPFDAAAAARPGTAPAFSPTKLGGQGPISPVGPSGRRSSSAMRPDKSATHSPAARWNSWAESEEGGAVQNLAVRELSRENKSFEDSPAAKKKKELARMRQEMRASLQQTQSKVLASMGGGAATKSVALGAGGGAGGDQVVAPMKIVSRPGSSAQPSSPSRPPTSQSVRFR